LDVGQGHRTQFWKTTIQGVYITSMFGPIYPSGLSEKDQNVKSLFVRKRSNCEKLTDDRRRTPSDGKL
jgi:hypothetical protein